MNEELEVRLLNICERLLPIMEQMALFNSPSYHSEMAETGLIWELRDCLKFIRMTYKDPHYPKFNKTMQAQKKITKDSQ